MSQYADRDPEALGEHYTKHVQAMTEEGLHSKAAIAAELAHRDIKIETLQSQLTNARLATDEFGHDAIKALLDNKMLRGVLKELARMMLEEYLNTPFTELNLKPIPDVPIPQGPIGER